MSNALSVLAVLAGITLLALLAADLSGHNRRAYAVLDPYQTVTFAGEAVPVAEVARRCQPLILLDRRTPSPPLLFAYYEAVAGEDSLDLVYYHVWEDEIHPNRWVHHAYRLFRWFYYGHPVRDIEYCQVTVNPADKSVAALRFETSPGDDYFTTISEHLIARISQQAGGWRMALTSQDGAPRGGGVVQPQFDGQRVVVGNATWNHLTRLVSVEERVAWQALDAPLKPLSDADYARGKFVRKSQGDHATRESGLSRLAGRFAMFWMLGAPFLLLKLTSRPKKQFALR